MATSGKLIVHVEGARLTRDTETFGKMDVYCVFNTRMQRIRTKTDEKAGKEPNWHGEAFEVDVKYIGDDMQMQVFDEDPCKSDLIGESTIKLTSLCANGGMDEWFTIAYKGEESGKLHLRSEWHPTGEEMVVRPPEAMVQPPQQVVNCDGSPAVHNTEEPFVFHP